MINRFSLREALELSPERVAFRAGGGSQGIWEVRFESSDKSYTLIHVPINPPGYPDPPLQPEIMKFRTMNELLAAEARLNVWLSNDDWYPVNEETRKRFNLPS